MKYIFGPVPSRRLGRSLGIDPIPDKTCNFQCIYCQLGRTTSFTNERQVFFPVEDILSELSDAIQENEDNFDYITLVGSGEPTLYGDLASLLEGVKKLSEKPICVITNGSLLHDENVQDALMLADVVLPTLDAGDEKMFIKINRPHPSLKYEDVVGGFLEFRRKFKGKFWVEIMLMRDINDTKEELSKLKEKIDLIQPDRIDINVPIRPPVEEWVKVPDTEVLASLSEAFRDVKDINFPEMGKFKSYTGNFEEELLNIIARHPMRQDQILQTFLSEKLEKTDILKRLEILQSSGKIRARRYNEALYWGIVR